MREDILQQIDQQIDVEKVRVARGEALERLQKNKDFQLIVLDGYLRNEAIRLVGLRGEPVLARPETQASILRDIDAIGSFGQYLRTVQAGAEQASKMIAQAEEERQTVLEENS